MNQETIELTIGLPVFNGAKFIAEALDSLLAQTFCNFELLVSDNASTDDTQSICEKYAQRDPRLRYVRQSENFGALANFQFVLDHANGAFFMWAAADDRWDSNWIEVIYTRIRNDKNIAGFGNLVHIDAQGRLLEHPANGARLQFVGGYLSRKLAFFLAYESLGIPNLFYAIYPRDALRHIVLRRDFFDYEMLFVLLDHVAYVQVGGAYLYKRIHGECAGGGSEDISRLPIALAPAIALWRDFKNAKRYLRCVGSGLRIVLSLLMPFKLLVALRFHVSRRFALWRRILSAIGR